MEFLDAGRFQGASLDSSNSEKLIKLMDWFVIRIEDGTDEDAAKLPSDEPRPARMIPTTTNAKPDFEAPAEVSKIKVKTKQNGSKNDSE